MDIILLFIVFNKSEKCETQFGTCKVNEENLPNLLAGCNNFLPGQTSSQSIDALQRAILRWCLQKMECVYVVIETFYSVCSGAARNKGKTKAGIENKTLPRGR